MADDIGVNPTASYTVAADVSGTVAHQRVKVEFGADGSQFEVDVTSPLPVTVSGPVQVSGAVSISVMPAITGNVGVSGAVSISAMPAITGDVGVSGVVSISGAVQVSGAVSISAMPAVGNLNTVDVTTAKAPAASSTGLIVVLKDGASVTIQQGASITWAAGNTVAIVPGVSVIAQVSGLVTVNTAAVGVSRNVGNLANVDITTSTVVAASSTGVVVVLKGGSVQVSGLVSVSGLPGVSVTISGQVVTITGVQLISISSIPVAGSQIITSGLPVWLAPTQTIQATVNTLAVGFSVNALVTGPVSISVMPSVAISTNFLTTLPPAVSEVGLKVWIAGGQSSTQYPIVITGTVQAAAATTAVATTTASGASGVTGALVWIANPTTVTVTFAGTTTGTVSLYTIANFASQHTVGTTGLPVWLGMSQTILVQGSVAISTNLLTTGVPNAASTGIVVWDPQLGIMDAVTQTGIGATGLLAYLAASQTLLVGDMIRTPIIIRLTSAAQAPDLPMAFTVYVTGAIVATTAWAVPAGKVFYVNNMQIYAKTSAVISFANMIVCAVTATASLSATSTLPWVAVCPYGITAATSGYSIIGLQGAAVAAGTTIGIVVTGGTTHTIVSGIIQGYLF